MIEDTIGKIELRLRSANALPDAQRAELEELLTQLRTEARSLPRSPISPTTVSKEDDAHTALGHLQESIAEFETTHPQLVGTVNRISTILANMGI